MEKMDIRQVTLQVAKPFILLKEEDWQQNDLQHRPQRCMNLNIVTVLVALMAVNVKRKSDSKHVSKRKHNKSEVATKVVTATGVSTKNVRKYVRYCRKKVLTFQRHVNQQYTGCPRKFQEKFPGFFQVLNQWRSQGGALGASPPRYVQKNFLRVRVRSKIRN